MQELKRKKKIIKRVERVSEVRDLKVLDCTTYILKERRKGYLQFFDMEDMISLLRKSLESWTL